MPHRQATRRFLATVLFTDIVGSTEHAAGLGDRQWRDLLERHHAVVRRQLKTFGGREMDTAGDGFFAVFDSPERAVRAAEAINSAVAPLGIELRAGVHTGECEFIDGKVGGMAVTIGARIAALAGPSEVLVSGSVRDLMTGSDQKFEGGTPQTLKGVPETWRVYRLVREMRDGHPVTSRRSGLAPLYTRRQRRRMVIVVAVVAAMLAVAIPLVVLRADSIPAVVVGENNVGLLEGDDLRPRAAIPVDERPTGVAVGAGAVWVSNSTSNTVSRIDSDTRTAVPIIVGSTPYGLAVGAGAVWVANSGDGTVSRIDLKTNRVTSLRVLPGPSGVVVAAGSVWVTNTLGAAVTQINPLTSAVERVVRVGAGPTGIAYGFGSLWVTNQSDGTVTRVDPSTRQRDAPIKVGNGPVGIAVGGGAVWVANDLDGSLSRIDATDHTVTSRTIAAKGGAYGVAVSGRVAWISNEYAGTLSRVDTRRFTLVGTVRTGGAPLGVALAGDRLWFANAGGGRALHRGGILTAVASGLETFGLDPSVIDPATSYDAYTWRLLAMTNDGLVGFRRAGGVQGALLVPDLATTLPSPTDDGLTYTFHVRRGVRYSDGESVRPSDIRRGIERTLQHDQGAFWYYQVIVGGARCHRSPHDCDLSAGIQVNDSARTVTFHLTRPEPDFLSLLALPPAYAVPSGTPTDLASGTAPPATGPYMVKTYSPQVRVDDQVTEPGRLELVRNPHFREWSRAAQPDANPDRIVIDTGVSDAEAIRRVTEGRAETLWHGVDPAQVAKLQPRFSSQLHTVPGIFMFYLFLNTTVPPFDNREARQAVSYAMDRRGLSSDPNVFGYGQAACQVLPPDFPGHEPYCPYTQQSGPEGQWAAADLGEAQRLVAASGTRGAPVVVLTFRRGSADGRPMGRRLVDLLNGLGYRASLRVVNEKAYETYLTKGDDHVQAGFSGWGADFPGQASYLTALVSCRRDPGSFNLSHFCDPEVERQIQDALEEQASDPGGAPELWAAIDRAVVDQAPIIPISNQVRHDFVSPRVGNYQHHPQWGQLPAQMWVQ